MQMAGREVVDGVDVVTSGTEEDDAVYLVVWACTHNLSISAARFRYNTP